MANHLVKRDDSNLMLKMFFRSMSQNTLEAYQRDLEDFNGYLGGSSLPSTMQAFIKMGSCKANRIVFDYKAHLEDRGLSPASINRKLSSIRSVTRFARQFGFINWRIEIKNERVDSYRDTRGPGRERIYMIIEMLRRREGAKAKRDLVIVLLMYTLALRASELINLELSDIELNDNRIWIKGKGRKQKVSMTVPDLLMNAIKNWLSVRGDEPGRLLFNFDHSSKGAKGLTRNGLYKLIQRLGKEANLSVRVRPHGFRHTSITEAIKSAQRSGITLNEVLQFSRHSSLEVLQVYADKERDVQGMLANLVLDSL